MGFTLKIENAPPEAVLWNGSFAENSFNYDPMADSGWLGIGEVWTYPTSYDKQGNPLYCTTLRIWALDSDNNILFDVGNLGPVEDGKSYIYDCSTGELYEVAAVGSLWPLALIGGVGVMAIGAAMAFATTRPGR